MVEDDEGECVRPIRKACEGAVWASQVMYCERCALIVTAAEDMDFQPCPCCGHETLLYLTSRWHPHIDCLNVGEVRRVQGVAWADFLMRMRLLKGL